MIDTGLAEMVRSLKVYEFLTNLSVSSSHMVVISDMLDVSGIDASCSVD